MLGNRIKLEVNVCRDFLQLLNGRRRLSLQQALVNISKIRKSAGNLIINMTIISISRFSRL